MATKLVVFHMTFKHEAHFGYQLVFRDSLNVRILMNMPVFTSLAADMHYSREIGW